MAQSALPGASPPSASAEAERRAGADAAASVASGDATLAAEGADANIGEAADCWALAGEWLWDGVADRCESGRCVVVQGQTIVGVCRLEEARAQGLEVELHAGCCLMPGLIDAHVHLEFSGDFSLHEQPAMSLEQLDAAVHERALSMLRAGITTARDLGGSRTFAALRLRDEIAAGRAEGPRLVCAGQPVTIPGGHCHQWGGAASNACEAVEVVERQVERGVDWIKVMVTGGIRTPGSNPAMTQFSQSDLRAIVGAATAHGRPVSGHAHGAGGVAAAVEAGCQTIEHCSWIGPGSEWGCYDDGVVAEMARRGVCVAPTAHANWRWKPMGDKNYRRISAALHACARAGVPLLASSDAGAIPKLPHDALAGGIEVLADMAGLTCAEALRTATSGSAAALGLRECCGRLAPGLSADLLLVRGDPTSDLKALRHPILVVARGRRAGGSAAPPPPPLPPAAREPSATTSRPSSKYETLRQSFMRQPRGSGGEVAAAGEGRDGSGDVGGNAAASPTKR
mmetsp:Transcript_10140/g.26046  ORF Transcript_10140/g.26046 Transcript_10140/m.26046 type:complete len:512 (+) Transcript_10140:87-1622(+)